MTDGDLRIQLWEDGADAERADTLTRMLRHELSGFDGAEVTGVQAGVAPQGTRGADAAEIGALLVSLGQAAQALGPVVGAIRAWLARGSGPPRTVRLELGGDVLELSQASTADQQRLVDLFVSRHQPASGSA